MQIRPRLVSHFATVLLLASTLFGAAPNGTAPRDMKLLIVAVDGNEPDYAALKFFVDTLGIPYQTAFTLDTSKNPPTPIPLPALTDGAKGFFQGVVLTNGNTGYCNAAGCYFGLDAAQWTLLENYARDFGVRIASYYTFPEARYGLAPPAAGPSAFSATDASPLNGTFTGPAPSLFPYLNTANGLRIVNSYVYLAQTAPIASGETITPFLTAGSSILGALHTKADGREYMSLTMDNNPNLRHSLLLNYGVLNWVMKGIFIGGRKVYVTPQVDDYFLPNDLFVQGQAACMPSSFTKDPTSNAANSCPTRRVDRPEIRTLADWQTSWQQKPQFQRFRVTHAFNGYGSTQDGRTLRDELNAETIALRSKFFWVSHTWDHMDLDCFNPPPNSGPAGCKPATEQQSATEISNNVAQAAELGLPIDSQSMVTPAISGLTNTAFLSAAVKAGIRYLVSDTSKQGLPPIPNTGTYTLNGILLIPRRPTNIFYNTTTGEPGAQGSLTDEYNYYFGPTGLFKDGSGQPFFAKAQTYPEIINTESENLLTYMLRSEIYPQMYHQSNLMLYNGRNSIFTDLHDATFNKFASLMKLPVISLTQADIGREVESKMAVVAAKVSGVLTPGKGITLSGVGSANVTVTGVCFGSSCESYGGQCVSKVPVQGSAPATVTFTAGSDSCAANPGLPEVPVPPTPAPPSASNVQYQNLVAVQQRVATLAQDPGVRSDTDREKLTQVNNLLLAAIDPSLWTSGDQLNAATGKKVFDSLASAAQQLTTMGKDARSQPDAATVQSLLTTITEAARALANVALGRAQTAAAKSPAFATAQSQFASGNVSQGSGQYPAAIVAYGNAWQSAMTAINTPN